FSSCSRATVSPARRRAAFTSRSPFPCRSDFNPTKEVGKNSDLHGEHCPTDLPVRRAARVRRRFHRLGPLDRLHDELFRSIRIAPADRLHPFVGLQILVVREEV